MMITPNHQFNDDTLFIIASWLDHKSLPRFIRGTACYSIINRESFWRSWAVKNFYVYIKSDRITWKQLGIYFLELIDNILAIPGITNISLNCIMTITSMNFNPKNIKSLYSNTELSIPSSLYTLEFHLQNLYKLYEIEQENSDDENQEEYNLFLPECPRTSNFIDKLATLSQLEMYSILVKVAVSDEFYFTSDGKVIKPFNFDGILRLIKYTKFAIDEKDLELQPSYTQIYETLIDILNSSRKLLKNI
jgi:hypothetical protein